jgi:hypothetical protein
MMRSVTLVSIVWASASLSCGAENPPPQPPPPVTSAAPTPVASASVAAPAESSSASPPTAVPPKPLPPMPAAKYTGFSTPESVLYDPENDRYLVSNVNGKPNDKDNNGFISVLSPDGQVTTLKWIEGGKNKVKLDAPKGLALVGGVLYAADITVVRTFDAKSGAPKGDIAVPGSTFLNDLASSPDGKVFVSDTGIKFGATGSVEPTGTDAVYVIDKRKVKALAKGTDLGGPNGLVSTETGVVVVTFGSGEVYRLDDKGKKKDVSKPPGGGLDGVVSVGDSLLVSSWQASAVFRGKLGGTFELALADQKSPADIGYDTKRGRVLVPHFTEDTVEAYELK